MSDAVLIDGKFPAIRISEKDKGLGVYNQAISILQEATEGKTLMARESGLEHEDLMSLEKLKKELRKVKKWRYLENYNFDSEVSGRDREENGFRWNIKIEAITEEGRKRGVIVNPFLIEGFNERGDTIKAELDKDENLSIVKNNTAVIYE